jgi:hypothetical protein
MSVTELHLLDREHAIAFSPPSDEPENKSGARVLPLVCGGERA